MKIKFYIYLLPCLFFLACANPQKLIDKGDYPAALRVSTRKLDNTNVKQEYLYAFEKAFTEMNRADIQRISKLKQRGELNEWLQILNLTRKIQKRQKRIAKALNNLSARGIYTDINLYPTSEKITEAEENIALLYYAEAQEHMPAARNGNRIAARTAHKALGNCRNYRADFKDALVLQKEMYELGTTHLLIRPTNYELNPRLADELMDEVIGNQQFPKRKDWLVYHLYHSEEAIDYQIDLSLSRPYVSPDYYDESNCQASTEVQVGCEEIKEWNATDSCWVTKTVPIYETVYATVTTYEQSKTSNIYLEVNILDVQANESIAFKEYCGRGSWYNDYSSYFGDARALGGLCDTTLGCRSGYPSDRSMLRKAACDVRWSHWRWVRRMVI